MLDPNISPPQGLNIRGQPAEGRFSVYRNNVVGGLCDVLAAGFPVLVRLLGADFFRAMAAVFIRQHPPNSPILMRYGSEMPIFLEHFQPVNRYPYLSDVARLELAIRNSYHAADSHPVAADILADVSAQAIEQASIELAPAVLQLRSCFPIRSIWVANTQDLPFSGQSPEDVLVVRKEFDPEPLLHPRGGYEFILATQQGKSILEANSAATVASPSFDLQSFIGLLLSFNAITAIHLSAMNNRTEVAAKPTSRQQFS